MATRLLVVVIALACAVAVLAHNEPHRLDAIKPEAITIAIDNAILMIATPQMLVRSTDTATLTFMGVSNPSKDDWIGVYTPGLVDVTRVVPVKYQLCMADPNYLATGKGVMKFRMINMRANYDFALFRNGTAHGVLVARSNVIEFVNYNEPLQAHLALTNKSSEMKVTWATRDLGNPLVKWGTASGVYTNFAPATTTSYSKEQMCGAPANSTGWNSPGLFHTAIMTNLDPDTMYFYVCGDERFSFTTERSFRTGPRVGPDQSLDFFVFGDLGQVDQDGTKEQQEVMEASLNTTTSLAKDLVDQRVVFHIGDISYARGYMTQWENFFDQILPVATRVPWMTCPGNHERDWAKSGSLFEGTDSGGECGVAYSTRMQMPRPAFDQTWWSVEMGPVHYVSMSTEHPFGVGSVQRAWIERDLASVDRKRTPWIVFFGHRPMYIDSTNFAPGGGDQPVAAALRDSFEELFQRYEVDVAFWGHHHSYQRTCPVLGEKCTSPSFGTVHVVTGAAGAPNSRNLQTPQPPHFQFVDAWTHGFTRARATPTTLRLQYVTGANRQVLDDVTLQLPHHRMP